MIIAEETLKKIRESSDIVKIISEYVKLEKKGGNFVGLCPFHPDTNPSMSVSPSKGIYKCFSCGASGNVFTFVQEYEHIPFIKAVQIVGEKSGIKVEVDTNEYSQNLEKYYDILQKATNFYEFYLKNTTDGKEALDYLYKRQLNDEIIKRFRIGLAPKESDLLYKTLLNEKIQPLDMIESGLVRSNQNYFDTFRNRIIFPIEDINGNIVGFSGRIYQNKKTEEPKYLNSNENIIFKKGNILYNYKQSINEIKNKDKVFVFEGFMDVIAAYRADINNAIATMGTALTQNQIKAISKTTNNVVICYDGDFAGVEATKKAIQLFTESKFNVKAVLMPEGLDPDEYINQFGKDKLNDYLSNQAISGIDYLYEIEKRDLILSDINSVEKFKNSIFKYLIYYNSNVLIEKYLQKLSNDINISIDSLKQDYKVVQPKMIVELKHSPNLNDFKQKEKKPFKLTHKKEKYLNAEKKLLKIIFFSKENCRKVEDKLRNKYVDKTNRNFILNIRDYYTNNEYMDQELFKTKYPYDFDILLDLLNNTKVDYTEINDLIDVINQYQNEKEMNDLIEKTDGNFEENIDSLTDFAALKKRNTKFKE